MSPAGKALGCIRIGARYRAGIAALDRAMKDWEPMPVRLRARAPERLQCSYDPPRVIRGNAGVAARGAIVCTVFGQAFQAG
jgi:hypothetical protein